MFLMEPSNSPPEYPQRALFLPMSFDAARDFSVFAVFLLLHPVRTNRVRNALKMLLGRTYRVRAFLTIRQR